MGSYVTDLLVEDFVLVELKAIACLDPGHHKQCLHYLRATGLPICLLINFGGPSLEIRRIVHRF